jgi:hypothetical protein
VQGVGVGVGVGLAVGVAVAVGVDVDVAVAVGIGVGDCAQYLPPELKKIPLLSIPPHTIISLPVHTVLCAARPIGALVLLVAVQAHGRSSSEIVGRV